jgi:hypothetical protein
MAKAGHDGLRDSDQGNSTTLAEPIYPAANSIAVQIAD